MWKRLGIAVPCTLIASALAVCLAGQADSRAKLERARELVAANRAAEAIPIYEELLQASPGDLTLALNLVVARFKAGQFAEVVRECRKLTASRPDLAAAWLFLGASELQLGRAARAIEPLGRALALQPGERNARLMLAEALLQEQRFTEAVEHFEQVSEALPENPRVWYGLERCYHSLRERGAGFEQKAEEAYQRLASLPPSPQLHELNARRLDAQLRYREAAAEWRKALALAPENIVLKQGLAVSLFHARQLDETLALLRELLEVEPASAQFQYLCGRTLLDQQHPEAAVEHLKMAVRLDPDLLAARAALGEAFTRLGRTAEAIPHLEAALTADDDGSVHFQLARAYQAEGRADEAKAALEKYQRLRQTATEDRKRRMRRDHP